MATVEKMPMLVEGYEMMTAQLKALKEERPTIVEAIEVARAHGDLSENAEYHAAKERQGQVEASIGDLEDKLSRAQIIDPTTLSGDKVVFGATVHLLDENDKPVTYQLVGQAEADAKSGKISYNSPLGRAMENPVTRRSGEMETTAVALRTFRSSNGTLPRMAKRPANHDASCARYMSAARAFSGSVSVPSALPLAAPSWLDAGPGAPPSEGA